ncbi:MAG: SIS domain-containing protein [Nanoarchaeota archaeon]
MKVKNNIDDFFEESKKVLDLVERKKIIEAVNLIHKTRKKGGKIFLVGNGGSASTASHFAADLSKWATGEGNVPTKTICLNENMPAFSALVNDNGWDNVYTEQLKNFCEKGDLIIGFSVHGGHGAEKAGEWSQNLTKAIDFVHKKGGSSLGFTGFDGGAMEKICTVNINLLIESTPQVEGLHCLLTHLIAEELRKIAVGVKINKLRK